MIPEGREIFPRMTVNENLMLGAYSIKDRAKVKANKRESYGNLSGAQKERESSGSDVERRRAADAGYLPKPYVKSATVNLG
jgi:ABC-type branched-subunit amino acid transport system ATPase component